MEEILVIPGANLDIKSVTIAGNPKLRTATVGGQPAPGKWIGSLYINDNDELETVTVNVEGIANSTDSTVTISNNPKLKTLDMGNVANITVVGQIAVENNPKLTDIKLAELKTLKSEAGPLLITGNGELPQLELTLSTLNAREEFLIMDNAQLTSIKITADELIAKGLFPILLWIVGYNIG